MRYVFATTLLMVSLFSCVGCSSSSEEGAVTENSSTDPGANPNMLGVVSDAEGEGSDAGDPAAMGGAPGGPGGMGRGGPSAGSTADGLAMPGDADAPGAGELGDPSMPSDGAGTDLGTDLAGPGTEASVGLVAPGTDADTGLDPGTTGVPTGRMPAGYNSPQNAPPGYSAGQLRGAGGLATGGVDGLAGDGLAGDTGLPGGVGPDGGVPGGETGSPAPTTLDGFADLAFQQGRERDAMQYLYAWALTSDSGAAEVLSSYQWVPELKRPSLAVRWGLGVSITTPPNFAGEMYPIGKMQNIPNPRSRGREDGGGPRGGGVGEPDGGGYVGFPGGDGGGGGGNNEAIAKYAGEFGQRIMDEFLTRMSGGHFGKVLKDAPPVGGGGGGGYGGDLGGGLGAPGADPGGLGLSAGLEGASVGADLGAPGGRGRMAGGPRGGGGGGAALLGNLGENLNLTRGLTFIGTAETKNQKELVGKAAEQKVDVFALLKVKVGNTRGGFVENETSLELYDPSKPAKAIFVGSTLNNIKVQQARQQNKDDGVEREIKKLFDFVDAKLSVTGLPEALQPAIVKGSRVDVLAASKYENPLPVLAEIRFYNRLNLLTDADLLDAFTKILGNESDAKTMVEGKEEDRLKIVEKWLPKG